MKLAKILSAAAASVVAAAALATSASATLTTVPKSGKFDSGTGSWMPVVYSDGTFDASSKDVNDYGIDCTKIASVEVTFTPAEPEYWEGEVGGAVVLSSKSADDNSHNWNGKEFWGVIDPELGLETADANKPLVAEKVGDLTYKLTLVVDETNNVVDNYALVQIAVQEWSGGMTDITILGMDIKDASGSLMMSWDANGTVTYNAAASGDNKESPDTGVESVAAVAGLAVVAAGAIVLSRKRK